MEILIIIDKLLSFYYNMTVVMTIVIYFVSRYDRHNFKE